MPRLVAIACCIVSSDSLQQIPKSVTHTAQQEKNLPKHFRITRSEGADLLCGRSGGSWSAIRLRSLGGPVSGCEEEGRHSIAADMITIPLSEAWQIVNDHARRLPATGTCLPHTHVSFVSYLQVDRCTYVERRASTHGSRTFYTARACQVPPGMCSVQIAL